jgi:hypothetical protein
MTDKTKVLRVTEVCKEETVYTYTIEVPEDFPSDWNEMTEEQMEFLYEEISYTDGYQTDSNILESIIDNVEEA